MNNRSDKQPMAAKRSDFSRCAVVFLAMIALSPAAMAEPYLAVFKGMQCSTCHSHSSGGGKRTMYGNVFAQTELSAQRVGDPAASLWTGAVLDWLSVGGNFRANYESVDIPSAGSSTDSGVERATVYLEADIVPNRLSLYIDQHLAPESFENRELYLKYKFGGGKFHIAAGQFFLPFGLRLQDDSAFVRQASGINFNLSDRGVQFGYESGRWSAQIAMTNGTGSGSVLDSTDEISFVASYVQLIWRAGVSINNKNSAGGDRQMQNVFFGLKTGSIAWLAEVDFISDESPGGSSRDAVATLLEGNWLFRKGHNIKVSYEYLNPDTDISEDHQVRWSVLWEYAPLQFLQARFGARLYDGIPQVNSQNRDEVFAEIHAYF